MYQYLTGTLAEKTATGAVIDVNGVGYQVHIPLSTYAGLPALGQQVRLLTHFIVREDVQALYGFASEEERQLFRQLLSVSGIGPKSAIGVLSGCTIPELKQAIIEGSLIKLTAIPGIGKKTAERLVVELREKIVLEERRFSAPGSKPGPEDELMEDSLRALIELGYRKQNAKEAIQRALKDADGKKFTVPDLIRVSLKYV